ncbi:MAG: alkylhydroperoxidase/carboxymuconolactone decarboxylase family protein YurZ [Saprospiraceae bacterium]|jgi:alkylhydroperoxidase/carboxymuconolactone decarboxylase family protein YurZ
MTKYSKHVRAGLLELMSGNINSPHEFTARYLARKNDAWITISQLCQKGTKKVLASHMNIPVHKLSLSALFLNNLTKGELLSIKAVITTYDSGGTARAALAGFGASDKIEITLESNSSSQEK